MEKTARGFSIAIFTDYYGEKCSIQKSSLAADNSIWLGIEDAAPKILASQAAAHGVHTDETTGWVPYPIPEEVLMTTRMHLDRDRVASLLPFLQKFVETGELE